MTSIILSLAVSSYATINISMSGNKTVQKAEKLAKVATKRNSKSSSITKKKSKSRANADSKSRATDTIERLFCRVVIGSFLAALVLAVVVTIVIDRVLDVKSMAGSSYIDIYLLTLSVLVAIAVGVSATLYCKWWVLLHKYNSLPYKKRLSPTPSPLLFYWPVLSLLCQLFAAVLLCRFVLIQLRRAPS